MGSPGLCAGHIYRRSYKWHEITETEAGKSNMAVLMNSGEPVCSEVKFWRDLVEYCGN